MEEELRKLLGLWVFVHSWSFAYSGRLVKEESKGYLVLTGDVSICSFPLDEVARIEDRDIYLT